MTLGSERLPAVCGPAYFVSGNKMLFVGDLFLFRLVEPQMSLAWRIALYCASASRSALGLFGYFFAVVRPPLFWPWEVSSYPSRSCSDPHGPK